MEEKKYVEIEINELARLQRLDGRVGAAQNYINNDDYPDIRVLSRIIGLYTDTMDEKDEKRKAAYRSGTDDKDE